MHRKYERADFEKGKKFENKVANTLLNNGYAVVQSIYPWLPYDDKDRSNCWEGQAQIDVLAFDFSTNCVFVVECKDWTIKSWLSNDSDKTNWEYIVKEYSYKDKRTGLIKRKLIKYEAFNPLFQVYWEAGMLNRNIVGNEDNKYYSLTTAVVFRENVPKVPGCFLLSDGLRLTGKPSNYPIKDLYNFLKPKEDFSFETFSRHLGNLGRDCKNRRGAFRLDWNNTKRFAMDSKYLGQYYFLL